MILQTADKQREKKIGWTAEKLWQVTMTHSGTCIFLKLIREIEIHKWYKNKLELFY